VKRIEPVTRNAVNGHFCGWPMLKFVRTLNLDGNFEV